MRVEKKIGIVIVSYGHQKEVSELLRLLLPQLHTHDRVVIVDNHPEQKTFKTIRPSSQVDIFTQDNRGFAAACNVAVASLNNEMNTLFFLNPDALPGENVISAVRGFDQNRYAACMPLLLLPDGRINSAGNVVHTTGLSWCDKIYEAKTAARNRESITYASGACLAISTEWWNSLGGMDENYFMYYEDTDLCSRIISRGGQIELLTNVAVIHDYEFDKGEYKWIFIERNVPLYILKNWPLSVILVLLPQNILAGVGFWMVAILEGRFKYKLRATVLTIKALPKYIKARRHTQARRVINGYEYLTLLHPLIDTPLLGGVVHGRLVNAVFRLNFAIAKKILKITS